MKQNGNALFLILIAVALFAALSYAITQSGRGGGSIDREQAEIAAAQLVQFYSTLQNGVDKSLLLGCDKSQISFEDAPISGTATDYVNPSAVNSCFIFRDDGGGITYSPPPANALDNSQSGEAVFGQTYFVRNVRANGVELEGGEDHMIIALTPFINDQTCRAINNSTFGSNTIPSDFASSIALALFQGAASFGGAPGSCTVSPSGSDCGTLTGCYGIGEVNSSGVPTNVAYHALFRMPP